METEPGFVRSRILKLNKNEILWVQNRFHTVKKKFFPRRWYLNICIYNCILQNVYFFIWSDILLLLLLWIVHV